MTKYAQSADVLQYSTYAHDQVGRARGGHPTEHEMSQHLLDSRSGQPGRDASFSFAIDIAAVKFNKRKKLSKRGTTALIMPESGKRRSGVSSWINGRTAMDGLTRARSCVQSTRICISTKNEEGSPRYPQKRPTKIGDDPGHGGVRDLAFG